MRIFVTGLSKSGKTTFCTHAAGRIPGLQYISVSGVLRKAGGVVPVATLEEGLANQRIAAQALSTDLQSGQHQIIDGHVLVETPEGPLLVPDRFYDQIRPDLLVHLKSLPEEILMRRESGLQVTGAQIAILMKLAQDACELAANRLMIPLVTLEAPSLDEFCKLLEEHIQHD